MFNFDGRDVVMALDGKMQNVIFYPDVPKSKDIKMPQTLKIKVESKCEAASNEYILMALDEKMQNVKNHPDAPNNSWILWPQPKPKLTTSATILAYLGREIRQA